VKNNINIILCLALFFGLIGTKDLFNFKLRKPVVSTATATVPEKVTREKSATFKIPKVPVTGKVAPASAKTATVPVKGTLKMPKIQVQKK
jgi:hypothetical protein